MTEDYYVVNKLAKGFLKANNIDSNSRLCMSSAIMGYRRAFGVDAPPCSYEDLDIADCIFIIGSNTAYCHPVLFMQIAEAKTRKGDKLKIIVVDPRKTPTAGIADLYIPVNPGSDVALVNGMIYILIKEGLITREFISTHTEGFEELEKILHEYTPEKVSEICGILTSTIREAAMVYGQAKAALTLWAMGLNQSRQGTDKNNAVINLSLVTGNIGRPGAGPFSLTGQANAMGGRETGGLANLLPGHRYIENPLHRREVSAFWECGEISDAKGRTAVELFDAIHKGIIKAVWIICTNPVVSLPNGSKFEEALKRAELVVVQDLYSPTDTTLFANIILPAAGFGEKEGTMTNSERSISYISKAVNPPGNALPDWEILTRFAHKVGFAQFFPYKRAEDIFEEYKLLTQGTDMDITGITYSRLQTDGPIQWPCPNLNHPGTSRLYTDGMFHTENGRAHFVPVEFIPSAESTDPDFSLTLTTGRIRDQWHTMTKTGRVESLMLHDPAPTLEVHPKDAAKFSVKDGDLVVVESRRGQATVQATLTDRIKEGTVFLPFHWGKLLADNGRANLMTVEAIDPFSKQPEFKACAVRISKKTFTEKRKVAIIGDDPVGLIVAETIIAMNSNMEVALLRTEKSMDTSLPKEIQIHKGMPVRIEPEDRQLFLEDGSTIPYEKLVLAPGNRFSAPRISGLSKQGVLVLERLEGVKKAIARLHVIRRAIIIGEGMPSLEAADWLRARGADVEIINPSTVLLEKQLDGVASELLFYEIKKRGITVKLGAEVEAILGDGRATGIQLATGEIREGDLILVEARLRANVDLAFRSGIVVNKGIVVGERLETSAPNVHAVGSAAEVRGVVLSDPEILAEQSQALGQLLAGDPTVRYNNTLNCTRFRALGLEVMSFGEFNADDEESNLLSYIDRRLSVYKKVVVRDNRVVGGLFFGDISSTEEILDLTRKRTDISALRKSLLSGNLKGQMSKGKTLCSCIGVTVEEIQAGIKRGMKSIEMLQEGLRVGTGCGTCLQEVRDLVKAANNGAPLLI
jgi:ferredoxin-nitrate reductase